MLKLALVFLVLSIFVLNINASAYKKPTGQKVHTASLKIKKDSSQVVVRHFNNAAISKYRNDPAFTFTNEKTGISLWDRFWGWVWYLWESFKQWVAHILEKIFGNLAPGRAVSVFKYIIIAAAAFLIVYVILKLIGIDLLKMFRKDKDKTEIPYNESLENIHEINFDEAIESALAIKNYRAAVRLLYLRCLKQLNDDKLINWKIEKTNRAYLNEIADPEQRRYFSIVTRNFEYVWYGNFPVDGQSYQNINQMFMEFKNRLT